MGRRHVHAHHIVALFVSAVPEDISIRQLSLGHCLRVREVAVGNVDFEGGTGATFKSITF
jgi:hypothetical protein